MSSVISKARFEALKRQATRLQRANPALSRSKALDAIAGQQKFANWSLLARAVEEGPSPRGLAAETPHVIQLRGVIRSRKPGERNISWVEQVLAKHPQEHYAKFLWMSEHFRAAHSDERSVRDELARMRRAIEFMDATDLRPSKAWVRLFGRFPERRPQEMDHNAVWRDSNGRYVVTTEPYLGPNTVSEINAWCDEHGWRFAVAPEGRGIWFPPQTTMLVMSPPKNGGDPQMVVSRL